jgi:hypothetical protein
MVWHVASSENGKKSNGRDIRRRLSQGEPATCRVGRKQRRDTLKCHQAVVVDEENFAVFGGGDTRTLFTSTQPRDPPISISNLIKPTLLPNRTASGKTKYRIAANRMYGDACAYILHIDFYRVNERNEEVGLFGGVRGDLTFVFERDPGLDNDRLVRERERDFKIGLLRTQRRK